MRYMVRQIPLDSTMVGSQVARVIETKNAHFPIGSWVVSQVGWRSHSLIPKANLGSGNWFTDTSKLSDFGDLPKSLGIGILGMPGITAYFGFLEICDPKAGETVLVNTAAGAVGSAVVQIAKIKGCRVIASAGTEEKCAWVKSLGADHVFNYKTANISEELKKAAPDGINCYFDNVGGKFTLAALPHMADRGRVSLCGAIATYNEEQRDKEERIANSPYDAALIIGKQLRLEGFMVYRWAARWMEGLGQMKDWVLQNKIQFKETATKGFENMPKAFIGLFHGDNIGKAIVNV